MFVGDTEVPIGDCNRVKLTLDILPDSVPEIVLTMPAIDFDIELLDGRIIIVDGSKADEPPT